MTSRILSMNYGETIFVSQKFNGDQKEFQQLQLSSAAPYWEEVVELFKGVKSVRAFEIALEKAEELYRYKHIPVKPKTSLPKVQEIWKMIDGELELFCPMTI